MQVLVKVYLFCFGLFSVGANKKSGDFPSILDYKPLTSVKDYAVIDKDFSAITRSLSFGTDSGIRVAKRIYEEGSYSLSVAELILDKKLTQNVLKGTPVIGTPANASFGNNVTGTAWKDYKIGDSVIQVVYDVSEELNGDKNCLVGGYPDPIYDGCFQGKGNITMGGQPFSYKYDVPNSNLNLRSLQALNFNAKDNIHGCRNCLQPDYKKYVDYYGKYDYADHIVTVAFEGRETSMARGNIDFLPYGRKAQEEITRNEMLLMTTWMEVLNRLEQAIDFCSREVNESTNKAIHNWDVAVAFYAGSMISDDMIGVLLYELANSRCRYDGACGGSNKLENISYVNRKVFDAFRAGQQQILNFQCKEARESKQEIARLMTIPLIRGTLRYAYLYSAGNESITSAIKGVAFGLAALPLVHACSNRDAEIMYGNIANWAKSGIDYSSIRDIFNRNLKCLRLSCDEVGGIVDPNTDEVIEYLCTVNDVNKASSNMRRIYLEAFVVYGIAVLLFVFIIREWYKRIAARNVQETEKQLFLDTPLECPPPEAIDTIIESVDYVPNYWKDCKKTKASTSRQTHDDEIAGEML